MSRIIGYQYPAENGIDNVINATNFKIESFPEFALYQEGKIDANRLEKSMQQTFQRFAEPRFSELRHMGSRVYIDWKGYLSILDNSVNGKTPLFLINDNEYSLYDLLMLLRYALGLDEQTEQKIEEDMRLFIGKKKLGREEEEEILNQFPKRYHQKIINALYKIHEEPENRDFYDFTRLSMRISKLLENIPNKEKIRDTQTLKVISTLELIHFTLRSIAHNTYTREFFDTVFEGGDDLRQILKTLKAGIKEVENGNCEYVLSDLIQLFEITESVLRNFSNSDSVVYVNFSRNDFFELNSTIAFYIAQCPGETERGQRVREEKALETAYEAVDIDPRVLDEELKDERKRESLDESRYRTSPCLEIVREQFPRIASSSRHVCDLILKNDVPNLYDYILSESNMISLKRLLSKFLEKRDEESKNILLRSIPDPDVRRDLVSLINNGYVRQFEGSLNRVVNLGQIYNRNRNSWNRWRQQ